MKMMNLGFVLFISLFFAVGFGLVGWGIWCIVKSRAAENWPTTEGVMNSCDFRDYSDSDGSSWGVGVSYSYFVSGRLFQGSRVAFGYAGSSAREIHEKLYKKLSRAKTVIVRYNPDHPEEAVLSHSLNHSTLMILIFGIVWLIFTSGFTVLWILSGENDAKMMNRIEVLQKKENLLLSEKIFKEFGSVDF